MKDKHTKQCKKITEQNVIKIANILSEGFGIIPKTAMQDRRLHLYSKALYAYLCSFGGAGCEENIPLEQMSKELGLEMYIILECLNELMKYGYVE